MLCGRRLRLDSLGLIDEVRSSLVFALCPWYKVISSKHQISASNSAGIHRCCYVGMLNPDLAFISRW